jgi:hypothetical protein
MAVSTPTQPYTLGALEAAGVSFLGAFASALALTGDTLAHSAEIGLVAAAVSLGYVAYQNS